MTDRHDRKLSPRLLPSINNDVDFTSLDYQGVDVFLASFSSIDKASVTKQMTKQLKALRALLAISSQLATKLSSESTLLPIIKAAGNIINAEKVFVLDIDHQQNSLVVSQSPGGGCNGARTTSTSGIEAAVIAQKKGLFINDITSSSIIDVEFYQQLQVNAKNVILVPIILGDTVMGLLIGFNKQADDFNFSPFDVSCLETIASSVAVVYQCTIYAKVHPFGNQALLNSPTSVTTESHPTVVPENVLKEIMDDSYRLLGADRISVFIDHGRQSLLCVSSLDIRGTVLPTTCGILGECFRHRSMFNIPNVKADKRHFKGVDERLQFETVSLMCVPVLGLNDEVLGVMEAVNNKQGLAFSSLHETVFQQLAHRVGLLFSRLKAVALQASSPDVAIARSLSDFSAELCVDSPISPDLLFDIAKKYGRVIALADDVYLLSSTADSSAGNLVLQDSGSGSGSDGKTYQGSEIHSKVREALTSKLPVDFFSCETDKEGEEGLLPGISASVALIVPLMSFSSTSATAAVLIFTRHYQQDVAVLSYPPDQSSSTEVSLQSVFSNLITSSSSQCCFSPMEKQALVSLSCIFSNALHFHTLAKSDEGGQEVGVQESGAVVLSQFDCPTVLSTLGAGDQKELSRLFEWQFNVLNIKDKTALHYAVVALFDKEFNFSELNINRNQVLGYILEVDKSYLQNPFHNFYHAVCVTHFDYMLLNASHAKSILSPFMIFASLLSALVHDVAHPGNTNMYEINMRSKLAILYNDTSVLENHHCSTAFRLMNKKGLGIFDGMEFAERAEIRKMMIACIIATDMHYHVSLIELISNRASQDHWHIDNFTERMNYGKILLHAADLSNPTRVFATSRAWAERVSEEFNAQGKKEKDNGIPVSTFLLSHDLKSFVKNELFFSGHIVFPMWKELVRLYPTMSHITDQIASNLESWKGLIKHDSK